MRGANEILLST